MCIAPRCIFAPRVQICTPGILCHVNGVLRKYTREQNTPGCKFAPTYEVEQIKLHTGVFLRKGVFCAHERKTVMIKVHFAWEFYNWLTFLLCFCLDLKMLPKIWIVLSNQINKSTILKSSWLRCPWY